MNLREALSNTGVAIRHKRNGDRTIRTSTKQFNVSDEYVENIETRYFGQAERYTDWMALSPRNKDLQYLIDQGHLKPLDLETGSEQWRQAMGLPKPTMNPCMEIETGPRSLKDLMVRFRELKAEIFEVANNIESMDVDNTDLEVNVDNLISLAQELKDLIS